MRGEQKVAGGECQLDSRKRSNGEREREIRVG